MLGFVRSDRWGIEEGDVIPSYRLFRSFRLPDQRSPNLAAALRFVFTVEATSDLKIRTRLHVFARPITLREKRTVLLGLYAAQHGGTVQVVAIPNTERYPQWLDAYLCVEPDAVLTCLHAFLAGKDLTISFSIPLDLETWSLATATPNPFLEFNLPNGPEFRHGYEQIRSQIERSHRTTRNRELLESWPGRPSKRGEYAEVAGAPRAMRTF